MEMQLEMDGEHEEPITTSSERQWAGLSHLTILISLFVVTVWVPWLIAGLIYLIFSRNSRYVAYQSLQALVFQLITFLILTVTGLLTAITLPTAICWVVPGLVLVVVWVGSLIYGLMAAVRCFNGDMFSYKGLRFLKY